MARREQLLDLADCLSRAAKAEDWDGLAAADGKLAVVLPQLAARGPWTASEQVVLAELQQAHAASYRQCTDALGQARARLGELSASQAGWQAYAVSGDFAESTT